MGMGRSPVQIRTATGADIPSLARVQLRSALVGFSHIFPEAFPKPTQIDLENEWSALVCDPAKLILAAEIDDELVGTVVFGPDTEEDKPTDGILLKLYVDPTCFAEGIGSALYEQAVAWFRTQDYTTARLWVLEANTRARHMYERRGWVPRPWSRTDWPDSGIDEIGYVLDLR